MAKNTPTPLDIKRDDIAGILRTRTQLDRDQIEKLANTFADPFQPCNSADIARILDVSKPTARRYRNLIVAVLEKGAAAIRNETNPEPSKATLERLAAEGRAAGAERSLSHNEQISNAKGTNANKPLSADEIARIIDRQIRKLDGDDKSSAAALKQILQLKIDFEDIRGIAAAQPIDPRKVLGPGGLANLWPQMNERFRLLLTHRRETPELYASMLEAFAEVVFADVASEEPLPEDVTAGLVKLRIAVTGKVPTDAAPKTGATDD